MNDPIFYFDTVATGIVISCQYYMIKSSFSAWKHVQDPTFGRCIKNFITWVAIGTVAGSWLLFSHMFLQ